MKKLFYISMALLVAAASLSSCNKKLKKELEELDQSVADLKAKNTELENQLDSTQNTLNSVNEGLEVNNPIIWTLNTMDDNYSPNVSVNKTFTAKYLLGSKDSYQYIWNTSGNIWEIYVEKYEDFDWSNYAGIFVRIDVTTNTLDPTNANNSVYGYHYSEYDYGTAFEFNVYPYYYPETITVSHLTLNTTTGAVDISLNYTEPAGYGEVYGTENTGNISWKGTCFNYQ